MVKTVTSIYIESDLITKAKLHGLNMSDFVAGRLEEYFLQIGIATNITDEHRKSVLRTEIKTFYADAGKDWEHFLNGRCALINRKFALSVTPEILRKEMLEYLEEKETE